MKTPLALILSVVLLVARPASAQLSFPNGSVLNMVTVKEVLYMETEIRFHTGIYKITDYQWEKQLDDSIHTEWDLQACMNGDCKVGLPLSGNFIPDFGFNDTTGFIRFHVNSFGITGSTHLKYMVRNKLNFNDSRVLEFNIFYTNPTGVNELEKMHHLSAYPNPANQSIQLSVPTKEACDLKIINSIGQQMSVQLDALGQLDVRDYLPGIYFAFLGSYQPIQFIVSHP